MENREKIDLKDGRELLKRLIDYQKPFKHYFILIVIAIFIATALDLYGPYLIKEAIDEKIMNKDLDGLIETSLIYLATVVGVFIFSYFQEYMLSLMGQKIIYQIRKDLYNHIISRSLRYFDHNPVGRLTTRTTNDIENLNEMYSTVLTTFLKNSFLIIGIIGVMIYQSPALSLYCLFVLPLIVIITIYFRSIIQKIYRESKRVLAKINTSLNENINGMTTIQGYHRESVIYEKYKNLNEEYFNLNRKETKTNAIFRPAIDMMVFIAMAVLIYFGGELILDGKIEIGVLFLFTTYLTRLYRPILELTEKYNILQNAISSSERIFTILDDTSEIKNPTHPIPIKDFKGEIEFKNVWFAYDEIEGEPEWILKDLSFKLNRGENIAIVGPTGAGKSSIISLITRLYDIQKGEILIDGKNIKELDKYDLRRNIQVIQQEVFLFSGDIKSNISLYNPLITDDEIKEVAKYVNLNHFIEKLPDKYHETVEEKAKTFSQGERQLLSFARALILSPTLLVLDEATSSIDTETEEIIQETIGKILNDKSTIAIAHRLSTIKHSDKIIVLKNGEIREQGNHQDLLKAQGLYYHLYQLQYKD